MSNLCTNDLIQKARNVCEFVSTNCESSYVNFYVLHYCNFNSKLHLTLPILSIVGILCFYLLSDTANKYLSSALTTIADKLKISQNLAGVTLLALGNGAPDVISSFVASDGLVEGIELSVGALLGSGTFITCFVFSAVVLYSDELKLNKSLFLRDVIVYLISLVVLVGYALNKSINIYMSCCLLLLYAAYVVVVIIQDNQEKKNDEGKRSASSNTCSSEELDSRNEVMLSNNINGDVSRKPRGKKQTSDELLAEEICQSMNLKAVEYSVVEFEAINQKPKVSITTLGENQEALQENFFYKSMAEGNKNVKKNLSRKTKFLENHYSDLAYRVKKHYFGHRETNWNEKGIFRKATYILIDFPLTILRDLTIPACELENWNQKIFIFMPIFCLVWVLLITKSYGILLYNTYIAVAIGVLILVLIVFFWRNTYRNQLPTWIITVCLLSFGMSLFWIWFIAKILVDVLEVLGTILNINHTFLGMTLLAFGNSAPDLSLNCALAKSGFGEMGIAGSIGGPLFNLLVGLGSSLLKNNILLVICVSCLALNLLRLLVHSMLMKFKLTKSVSYIGFLIYFVFVGVICFFTFI